MNFEQLEWAILEIVCSYGSSSEYPAEAQEFFEAEIARFSGTSDEFLEYVRQQAPLWFPSVNGPPEWIQGEDWQFNEGRPMLYIGHVDVPYEYGLFLMESRFYVFYDRSDGTTKTVYQIM